MASSENTRKIVVENDGRITALLELTEKPGALHEASVTSLPLNIGGVEASARGLEFQGRHEKGGLVTKGKQPPIAENASAVFTKPKLMQHAIETFGSEEAAKEWMSIECGALNNESPANFIHKTGNLAEVDRILGCIDFGMIA